MKNVHLIAICVLLAIVGVVYKLKFSKNPIEQRKDAGYRITLNHEIFYDGESNRLESPNNLDTLHYYLFSGSFVQDTSGYVLFFDNTKKSFFYHKKGNSFKQRASTTQIPRSAFKIQKLGRSENLNCEEYIITSNKSEFNSKICLKMYEELMPRIEKSLYLMITNLVTPAEVVPEVEGKFVVSDKHFFGDELIRETKITDVTLVQEIPENLLDILKLPIQEPKCQFQDGLCI